MIKNDKTAKRLYRRINDLEIAMATLTQVLGEMLETQNLKIEEIEEVLEMNE